MKQKIYLIIISSCFIFKGFAQTTVPIETAKDYIGKTVTICSKVFGSKGLEKITFLNLGASHPNSLLTVVIFAKDYSNFATPPAQLYADKEICVTGEVKEFKGKLEITVTKPEEIKLAN
jgi:DNA/RNA endonuclease YhcR with UshA esterase domain